MGSADAHAHYRGRRLAREVLAVEHLDDAPVLDDETAFEMFPDATPSEIALIQRGYDDAIKQARAKERP